MKTYVMLLRGINVGGKNRMAMKDLVALLETLDFKNIRSYIQSGNIVFSSARRPGKNLAKSIGMKFGFTPQILILDKAEFMQAVELNPFQSDTGKNLHFFFAAVTPKPNPDKIATLAASSEQYKLIGNVFYLFAPEGIGRSRLAANIEQVLGVPLTGRNLNTINKINELIDT